MGMRPPVSTWISCDRLSIEVLRKPIKHVYFRVYAPDGRIRVTVPLQLSEAKLQQLLQQKQPWLLQQQEKVRSRQPAQQLISGEIYPLWGVPYRLEIDTQASMRAIQLTDAGMLVLQTRPTDSLADRDRCLQQWYRQHLQTQIPPLLDRWQPQLNVAVSEWRIKRMKTLWGSCNICDRRIWLNLELAKYPLHCLESVLVHELVHLLERNHTPRFYQMLDHFLPTWRASADRLKQPPAVLLP
nr:M48 family peptidase [Synechococcus elongatus PCC 11802]